MKARIIAYLRRTLPRFRKTPPVRFLRRAAQIAYRLIENDNYNIEENGERRVLEVLAKKFDIATAFDVGANVGEYSLILSGLFPRASIYAFEPVPQTYQMLKQRIQGSSNIKPFNFGLNDRDDQVDFFVRPDDLTNSTSFGEASNSLNPTIERIVVRCGLRNSEKAAKELGVDTIDFLKIDTEGNDWFVLNGFSAWLKSGRIKVIQFEYGLTCIYTKRLLMDHYRILEEAGYRVGKIFPKYVDFRPYTPLDEDFIGPNFLAVHASTGLDQLL